MKKFFAVLLAVMLLPVFALAEETHGEGERHLEPFGAHSRRLWL